MEQMIDKCVNIMNGHGIVPEVQPRSLMTQVMPELKRWKKSD